MEYGWGKQITENLAVALTANTCRDLKKRPLPNLPLELWLMIMKIAEAREEHEESIFYHYNYFENDRFELEFYREVVNSFNPNAIMEDQETADGYYSIRVNACFNFMKLFNHDIKGIFFYEDTEDYRKNLQNLVRSLQTMVYKYYFWFKDSTDPDMVENAISIASLVDNLYSLITKKAPGFLSDPVRDNYLDLLYHMAYFIHIYYWCKRYEPQTLVWNVNMLNALAYSSDDFYNKYYEFDHLNSFMPLPRNIPYCYCCDAPWPSKMMVFDYIQKKDQKFIDEINEFEMFVYDNDYYLDVYSQYMTLRNKKKMVPPGKTPVYRWYKDQFIKTYV